MNFFQNLLQRIEYGDYVPAARYGQLYEKKIGKETFTLTPTLLKGKTDWVLRLELNRRWGSTANRTIVDLHFHTLDEIATPIQQLLRDTNSLVTKPNLTRKAGIFEKMVMTAAAGKLVRGYGRIDRHPKNAQRFQVELFLSWDEQRHWLMLWDGSDGWSKWPVGVAETLNRMFPQIHEAMTRADTKK